VSDRRAPKLDIVLPEDPRCPQPTPRRHPRTLCRWLTGALPGGARGVATLLARLEGPLRERRHLVTAALVVAHLRGDLRPSHWQSMTGLRAVDPSAMDGEMDLVWDVLAEAGLVRPAILYHPGVERLSAQVCTTPAFPPSLVARWVRTERWSIAEDDEDLLLFDAVYAEPLLRAAARPDAARSELARGIVAHAARDAANAGAVHPAPPHTLAELAPRHGRLAEVARETGAPELAQYLDRLASYGRGPRPFDEDQARQAFADLARCAPPSGAPVRLETTPRGWVGFVSVAGDPVGVPVHLDRETGVLTSVVHGDALC
jgi:hypothetical protein